MSAIAEKVSATLTTNRNCTIEITNVSSKFCLINPMVFMSSGFSHHPPQPTIRTAKTEVCTFIKDDNTATGAVGLLTYDLYNMQSHQCCNQIVIMFSVPYDHNLYKNKLALGILERSTKCDEKLFDKMYEGKDKSCSSCCVSNGSGLDYKTPHVELRGTMSTIGRAIVKVELYDRITKQY